MRLIAKLGAVCTFAVLVLVPSVVLAQATITGVVRDTSGAVLPGVTVEAASPVLIEKVRTAVTDGNGRYQLIDLRPGAYTVTFTLAGFNTFKRDGVTVAGSGVAVDAELRVGALEETVTVTGEAPVVDTQSLTQQRVINADLVDALPSARNYFGIARMIPGTQGGGNDVGGSLIQDVGQSVTVHGSRNVDQRITINGINTMTLQAGGNIGGQTPDMGSAAEVTVDTTSLGADLPTGGVRVNFVPKDGGNRFSDSTFFSVTGSALQGDNFTDAIKATGLAAPNKILHAWDINESLGGPFKQDKVWFWFSTRYNDVANQAPVFVNKNAFNPNEWLYVPDTSQPGINKGQQFNNSIRVTWQANAKNKFAGTYKADRWCNCPSQMSATLAPEAARDRRFPRLRQEHLEWTSPVTNKLLLEAVGMHLFERWGDMHLRSATGSITEAQEAIQPQMISVTEQSTGLVYRGRGPVYNNTAVPSFAFRIGASYVTGSHAFKLGYNRTAGYLNEYNYQLNDGRSYRFNNGVPNQITMRATPYRAKTNLDADQGFYAQDRWTMNRMTLAGAIRFDAFNTSFPDQVMGPAPLTPSRNITFPARDNISWRDVTYRSGVSYDLFGNGKTALKFAANKYLLGQTLNGLGRNPNPVLAAVTQVTRTWNDTTTFPAGDPRNGNFVPDCDLLVLTANGECGVVSNLLFGSATAGDAYDKDLINGFNHRQSNWEFTASVQHELMQGVAIDVGYFRRVWSNFQVTDNILTTAADYTRFSYNVPADPRLPNTSGYTLAGFYDVNPEFAGRVSNLNALDSKYGHQKEHWNGIDIGINARTKNGLTMNAGLSTGSTMTDNCEIVAKLPEMLLIAANGGAGLPAGQRSDTFCHNEEPWLTQFKAFGSYTIPHVDVQVSGTYRNTNNVSVLPVLTASNAALLANSTLGRNATGAPSINLQIVEPNEVYLKRRNELDVRFGKVLRIAKARAVASVDIFNALNNNAPVNANQAFASYLNPLEILNARVLKFSVAVDF